MLRTALRQAPQLCLQGRFLFDQHPPQKSINETQDKCAHTGAISSREGHHTQLGDSTGQILPARLTHRFLPRPGGNQAPLLLTITRGLRQVPTELRQPPTNLDRLVDLHQDVVLESLIRDVIKSRAHRVIRVLQN